MTTNPCRLLSIDPGATFGFAVWHNRTTPTETGTFTSYSKDWQTNVGNACSELEFLICRHPPRTVVCEKPFFASGAAPSNNIVKLTLAVGGLIEVCRKATVSFKFVEVNHWRGQLQDKHVQQRLKLRLKNPDADYGSGHAWDAVGIGLYYFTGRKL